MRFSEWEEIGLNVDYTTKDKNYFVRKSISPIKEFNNATIKRRSPIVHLKNGFLIPASRAVEVSQFLSSFYESIPSFKEDISTQIEEFKRNKCYHFNTTKEQNSDVSDDVIDCEFLDTKINDEMDEKDFHLKDEKLIFFEHPNAKYFVEQIHIYYSSKFDYEVWYDVMKDVQIRDCFHRQYFPLPQNVKYISLSNQQIDDLFKITKFVVQNMNFQQTIDNTNEEIRSKISEFIEFIDININIKSENEVSMNNEQFGGYFVRLSSRSSKDFFPTITTPAKSAKMIVDRFIHSTRTLVDLKEYKRSIDPMKRLQIILIPWKSSKF